MFSVMIIAVILLGALFWSRSMQARQAAIARAENICKLQGWQFLDDTVALRRLSLKRISGRWVFVRKYVFEYFQGGEHRLHGEVILYDARVVEERVGSRENVPDILEFQNKNSPTEVSQSVDSPIFQNNILQFPSNKKNDS